MAPQDIRASRCETHRFLSNRARYRVPSLFAGRLDQSLCQARRYTGLNTTQISVVEVYLRYAILSCTVYQETSNDRACLPPCNRRWPPSWKERSRRTPGLCTSVGLGSSCRLRGCIYTSFASMIPLGINLVGYRVSYCKCQGV